MVNPGQSRYGELTKGILSVLAAGALIVTLAALPGLALALQPFVHRRRYRAYEVKRAVYRLRAQRVVRFQRRRSEVRIKLTDRGRERLAKYQLNELFSKRPARWDGRWHVLVFDIPEERKAAREALRAKLRYLDFYQLQRSVFITPYDCRAAVEFLKEFYDVHRCLHYLEVVDLDCHEELRRYFNLLA